MAHAALLEALGRALASWDLEGSVSSKRLAFAVGDEIVYPATVDDAADLISQNTAIVQHLEWADPFFDQIVSKLTRQTNRPVSVSAYIADVRSRAFSWHVDKWDNVVLQLQGRKAFDLARDTARQLFSRDALFVPKDFEHRTRTLERSVHLSVAILR